MAMPSELAGVDFNQYKNWQVVNTPSGGTYYAVPGTAFVYDPFLSQAKGQIVLYQNPTPQLEQQQQAEAEREQQLKLQQQASDPVRQLIPIAGSTAGIIGSKYAIDALTGGSAAANTAGGANLAAQGANQAFAEGAGMAAPEIISASQIPAGGASTAANLGAEAGLGITPYLGVAGAGLGAYGTYQGIKNHDPLGAGLSGAGMGLGLGMAAPLVGLGPLGWGALGLMALGGAGVGSLGAFASALGDKDQWKTEGKRLSKLAEQGINIPEPLMAITQLKKGRSKDELINFEQQKIDQGMYGNTSFAKSRNESDLKPQDIWGSAAFFEKFGNDWLNKYSEAERQQIAQKALDSGAVREHKGTIDVDWNKVNLNTEGATQGAQQEAMVSNEVDPNRIPARGNTDEIAKILAARRNQRGMLAA